MEWNYCLLIFMISLISQSYAYVEIIQHTTNWIEAKEECFSQGGRLAYPDELYQSNCSQKKVLNVWTGKYDHERPTPWIAKVGCFFRNAPSRHSKFPLVECYSSCKSASFGFMHPWCSCENETTAVLKYDSSCLLAVESRIDNALWLYNQSEIGVSNDDYKFDCITAQCTENGTIFKAVDCNSSKFTHCQARGFNSTAKRTTQVNSERICNGNDDHLIWKQFCLSFNISDRNTPEFWTGIQRYRYNVTESLKGTDRKNVNSTNVYNCVNVNCENGKEQVENTENCRHKLDGYACIFNGTSNNTTTVKPSPVSSLASANISSSMSNTLHFKSNTASLESFSDQSSKHAVDDSIINEMVGSISAITNNYDMSTALYTSVAKTNTVTEFSESYSIQRTTTRRLYSSSHNFDTVYSSSENWFTSAIISSSEFGTLEHVSTSVSPQSTVETSVYVGIWSSVLMSEKSIIGSSILPTSVTSKLFSDYSSKHDVRAYINTSLKLAINSNIDMSSSVYSLAVKNKSGTEVNGRTNMHSTTIMDINNSRSPQFSTGLIVGVPISIFFVLIIGVIGICRLRHQGLFKDKALDYTIPMTKTIDPNYHDIDVNLEKETHIIRNDSTQPMITTTDDDKQFDITNGTTNIPNDVYAVVVKNGISITPKTEKNQDKDENTSSNKPESDYHILHQSRRISGNESNNIYDTSGGHNDDNDPTYNTTTHVHAKERANESDYDHF